MGLFAPISLWLDLFLVLGSLVATGYAEYVPFLQPGFFFDYTPAGQSPPIPITEQCETIHLEWGRRNAIGPNPVAPYSMVVYVSSGTTPFTIDVGRGLTFDWDVPFAPGTQYQICMWDSNGVPGGCQAMYTVIQNSTVANPSCQNVTFPVQLEVEPTVAEPAGPLSQTDFVTQCTDLFVTPKSGKPPFTLTVAPALHPPYNITSNSMDTIDWTVSLSWSFPFFLSLESSDGQLWSYGPLHAGGFGSNDCLAPGTIPSSKAHDIAVAAGLGGAFAAAIVGALATFLFIRMRDRKRPQFPHTQIDVFDSGPPPPPDSDLANFRFRFKEPQHVSFESTPTSDPTQTQGTRQTRGFSWRTVSPMRTSILSPAGRSPQILSPPVRLSSHPRSRAYVLHHDAGRAPITVITDATEVVELPPRYRRDSDAVPLPPISEKSEPLPLPARPMRAASSASVPLPRR
ncbi:hypothetical protein K438DRAFT_1662210 [Mycena galopus ATCC 62051]|nr:hypothetical protein K438DRAFT_1662210 [Mycena galopus ATCC 62051]